MDDVVITSNGMDKWHKVLVAFDDIRWNFPPLMSTSLAQRNHGEFVSPVLYVVFLLDLWSFRAYSISRYRNKQIGVHFDFPCKLIETSMLLVFPTCAFCC